MNTDHVSNKIIDRPFHGDRDYLRVRRLLIDSYPITPTGLNWEVRRWDGWRFYDANPVLDKDKENKVHLWLTDDETLVGAVHPEGKGDAFLEIHPDYRHIEEAMVVWAEENLARPTADGKQHELRIFVYDYDRARQFMLERRGYEKTASGGVIRRMRCGRFPPPQPKPSAGYTIRTTRPDDMDECQQMADFLNAAFNRDFHNAGEYHVFTHHAPCFRNDLDLVAVAPDGTFAAYVGGLFCEENNYGVFEPVCTHPDHLRRGLASWLMIEALHLFRKIGVADVYVGTGDQKAANALYDSLGFTEVYKGFEWIRRI